MGDDATKDINITASTGNAGKNDNDGGNKMPSLPPITLPSTTNRDEQSAGEPPEQPAPNSRPRDDSHSSGKEGGGGGGAPIETYVYRDFAKVDDPSAMLGGSAADGTGGDANASGNSKAPSNSMQSQKLPSKLGAMLCDPDLASIITWMPHGRSWKILNRELFSSFALPRYFGHSNHASFVRIVNAWGFRRISVGADRDSYYHELFLRGKPQLHQRMKRLPSCHRKTPVDKDDRCPNFYELAKVSPLPEVNWVPSGGGAPQALNMAQATAAGISGAAAFATPGLNNMLSGGGNGLMGNQFGGAVGGMGTSGMNNPMLSSLLPFGGTGNDMGSTAQIAAYAQNLQRENENLLLRIRLLEQNQMRNQPSGVNGGNALSNNMGGGIGNMTNTASNGGMAAASAGSMNGNTNTYAPASTGQLLEQELALMQRNYGAISNNSNFSGNMNSIAANSGNMMNGMMSNNVNAASLLQSMAGNSSGSGQPEQNQDNSFAGSDVQGGGGSTAL